MKRKSSDCLMTRTLKRPKHRSMSSTEIVVSIARQAKDKIISRFYHVTLPKYIPGMPFLKCMSRKDEYSIECEHHPDVFNAIALVILKINNKEHDQIATLAERLEIESHSVVIKKCTSLDDVHTDNITTTICLF
jgi:pterin-4a-carbinolamine dehydratase